MTKIISPLPLNIVKKDGKFAVNDAFAELDLPEGLELLVEYSTAHENRVSIVCGPDVDICDAPKLPGYNIIKHTGVIYYKVSFDQAKTSGSLVNSTTAK